MAENIEIAKTRQKSVSFQRNASWLLHARGLKMSQGCFEFLDPFL